MSSFFVCTLTAVPLRAEAAHRSEMVSQVLFGEMMQALETGNDFTRVQCLYDGYEGWVQSNQLTPIEKVFKPIGFVRDWSTTALVQGAPRRVPLFAPVYKKEHLPFVHFEAGVAVSGAPLVMNEAALETVYAPLLGTPYLWGGRSPFGIDCSGFTQQVMKLFGSKLLRDASLQITQGKAVALAQRQPGDLAFFNNEKGRITHVGIVLGEGRIVHAAGQVRIDVLTAEGIWNEDVKKQTHVLHSVRRMG